MCRTINYDHSMHKRMFPRTGLWTTVDQSVSKFSVIHCELSKIVVFHKFIFIQFKRIIYSKIIILLLGAGGGGSLFCQEINLSDGP